MIGRSVSAALVSLAVSMSVFPARTARADAGLDKMFDAWATEFSLGAGVDRLGWGDERAFVVVEPGLFFEGRRRWFSLAGSASAGLDLRWDGADHRFPPLLFANVRVGVEGRGFRLRLGPAFAGNDRGAHGYRTMFTPLGSMDLRYQHASWARTYLFAEAGGHGTQATVGGGVHLGLGRLGPDGPGDHEAQVAVVLGPMLGLAMRLHGATIADQRWTIAGQVGVTPVPYEPVGGRFEAGIAVGRRFGGRREQARPADDAACCRHFVTAALAEAWRRRYVLEYEGRFNDERRDTVLVGLGWADRSAGSMRVSGPLLQLGGRLYLKRPTVGPWLSLNALTLELMRASGWQSRGATLGTHVDDWGLGWRSTASVGYAQALDEVRLSFGLGVELQVAGFHPDDGRRGQARLGVVAHVNIGFGL
jgi:hypothetical protein